MKGDALWTVGAVGMRKGTPPPLGTVINNIFGDGAASAETRGPRPRISQPALAHTAMPAMAPLAKAENRSKTNSIRAQCQAECCYEQEEQPQA